MNTFSNEIKLLIAEAQNNMCGAKECFNQIHSFHHQFHNTKFNRKKFPLFIHSPFNCIGLCYKCHTNFNHLFKINEQLAQVYEEYLESLIQGLNVIEE